MMLTIAYICAIIHKVTRIEKLIISNIKRGLFVLTLHARQRMDERSVFEQDIIEVAKTLKTIKHQKTNDTYLLTGLNTLGETLVVSAAKRESVIIVTVFFEE